MFKQFKNKTLLIVFVCLLMVVVAIQAYYKYTGDSNFKTELVKIDTAKVSSIVLIHKNKDEILLTKSGKSWSFTSKGKTYVTAKSNVDPILAAVSSMSANSVAGLNAEDQTRTGCADSMAIRVKIQVNETTEAEFLVGKFKFEYPRTILTYIRLADEDEVYAVKVLMPDVFNKTASDLRDKTLVNFTKNDILKITYTYPSDSSFVLSTINNKWFVNGVETDSTKTAEYINRLGTISGNEFVDDNTILQSTNYTARIEGKNFQPFELKCSNGYIVTSSINQTAKFDGNKGDLIKTIFVGPKHFFAVKEKKKK